MLADDGSVSIANVPSWRARAHVSVEVEGHGRVTGDVAWGGNWFFLVDADAHGVVLEAGRVEALTAYTAAVSEALVRAGVTGEGGALIDHIELYGRSPTGADARNFVLCPGKAYDRSPCGTGTSAKLACLAADGVLAEGAPWRQESIIGSVFEGAYRRDGDRILPLIRGRAWVNSEARLVIDPSDPFAWGL
jgi:4-hydroxyproline epimerase